MAIEIHGALWDGEKTEAHLSVSRVTADEFARLLAASVEVLVFTAGSTSRAASDLAWVNGLPCVTTLSFEEGAECPDLSRVDPARRSRVLIWENLPAMVSRGELEGTESALFAYADSVAGGVVGLPTVRRLEVGHLDGTSTAGDRCSQLTHLKLRGRRRPVAMNWENPPRALVDLQVDDMQLASVDALASLTHLQRVVQGPTGQRAVRSIELDVSPLVECPELVWLDMATGWPIRGLDALMERLPGLRARVAAGRHDGNPASSRLTIVA
ncbi:hypothetical protein [Demequina subtropica]|uniref:hypothetical protein n=1 Tax=Demequina subtropica TaxID=1638989 RepID=UPI0012E02406|nr:hypothetical protein [Demequina subtropica]